MPMFCTNCGTKRVGKFCGHCGHQFADGNAVDVLVQTRDQMASDVVLSPDEVFKPQAEPLTDWRQECRHQVLINAPEVRDLIARYTAQAKKGMSAEEFMKICDYAYKPLVGISLTTVASIALPLNRKFGFKYNKSETRFLKQPIGTILVGTLCFFARRSHTLKKVHQATNGCAFEAALSSNIWAMDSEIFITVEQLAGQCKVEARTQVYGQLYDWGKSAKWLQQLFEDLNSPLE